MKKWQITLIVAYAAMGVFTFGHAFNRKYDAVESQVYCSFVDSICWPLYWSATLQENNNQ